MANWCYNNLTILSDEQGKMRAWFKEVQEASYNQGQLPSFFKGTDHRFIFNIVDDPDNITFESKWSPPEKEMCEMGKKFKCSFQLFYEESAMGVYGELFYDHLTDTSSDIYLDKEDIDQIEYDEEDDSYLFEGEKYESDSEPKDILLGRKIKINTK